jgi:tryptophan 2,3-dioxygenase
MVEALFGRRDSKMAGHLPPTEREAVAKLTEESLYLGLRCSFISTACGFPIPAQYLERDFSQHYTPKSRRFNVALISFT